HSATFPATFICNVTCNASATYAILILILILLLIIFRASISDFPVPQFPLATHNVHECTIDARCEMPPSFLTAPHGGNARFCTGLHDIWASCKRGLLSTMQSLFLFAARRFSRTRRLCQLVLLAASLRREDAKTQRRKDAKE